MWLAITIWLESEQRIGRSRRSVTSAVLETLCKYMHLSSMRPHWLKRTLRIYFLLSVTQSTHPGCSMSSVRQHHSMIVISTSSMSDLSLLSLRAGVRANMERFQIIVYLLPRKQFYLRLRWVGVNFWLMNVTILFFLTDSIYPELSISRDEQFEVEQWPRATSRTTFWTFVTSSFGCAFQYRKPGFRSTTYCHTFCASSSAWMGCA